MKSRILTCITATLFAVLPVPVQLMAQVAGTGTANYVPIWTNSTTLGNSKLFQTGNEVGIGTTSPAARLDVIGLKGTDGINGGSAPTNAPKVLQVTGGRGGNLPGGYGSSGTGGPLQLTSGTGGSDGSQFTVHAFGGTGGAILMTGGTGGKVVYPRTFVGGDGGSVILQPGAGGSGTNSSGHPGNIILTPTGGRVGIRTTTPQATLDVAAGFSTLADAWMTRSSRRFKTNIRPLERALEKIEQLQGVAYERKVDGKHEIGVVAEDVARIVPEVVSRDPNTHEVQGVDYSRLAALLIEAVKSQQAELQSQKAEIQQLKARIKGQ